MGLARPPHLLLLLLVVVLLAAGGNACDRKPASQCQITGEGLNLVKQFEGFRGDCYADAVGKLTVGYGHNCDALPAPICNTCRSQPRGTQVMSRDEATELLRRDLERFSTCVRRSVRVPLTDNEFSALASFAYNAGCGSLQSSTLLQRLNAGHYEEVDGELMKWTQAGGRVLAGLERRRRAEGSLFRSSGCGTAAPTGPSPDTGASSGSSSGSSSSGTGTNTGGGDQQPPTGGDGGTPLPEPNTGDSSMSGGPAGPSPLSVGGPRPQYELTDTYGWTNSRPGGQLGYTFPFNHDGGPGFADSFMDRWVHSDTSVRHVVPSDPLVQRMVPPRFGPGEQDQ